MGQPAAKQGDQIVATDTHIVMVPVPPPTPTPLTHPFAGIISGALSSDVNIMGMPAATVATIKVGSATVKINGKAAARNGDTAETCNDPSDLPVGTVVAAGTVLIG
jgi:uncharacterized Zn-binding protein involved in type VI secretion